MKKGFTLIELLAVIVILAIIALIATPIVINIISDTKVSTMKRSSELYIDAIELTLAKAKMDNIDLTTCNKLEDGNLICGETPYKVEIKGNHPEYIEVKTTQKGEVSFAMKTGGYCIMRTEEDESISYKKIVSSVNNSESEIKEERCSLNPYTSSSCFAFDSTTGTITNYYYYENNDKTQPSCPRDVVIPNKINGKNVVSISNWSMYNRGLTSVVIPEGVISIGTGAFAINKIKELSLPTTLTSIAAQAFRINSLPQEKAYIYKRNSDGSIDYSTIIGYGGESMDIVIPSEKNGVKLTTIGDGAFRNCSLNSIVIPNTVKIIGSSFFSNNLKQITIPQSVITIKNNAFLSNPLERVIIKNKQENITFTSSSFGSFDINNIVWEPVEE